MTVKAGRAFGLMGLESQAFETSRCRASVGRGSSMWPALPHVSLHDVIVRRAMPPPRYAYCIYRQALSLSTARLRVAHCVEHDFASRQWPQTLQHLVGPSTVSWRERLPDAHDELLRVEKIRDGLEVLGVDYPPR